MKSAGGGPAVASPCPVRGQRTSAAARRAVWRRGASSASLTVSVGRWLAGYELAGDMAGPDARVSMHRGVGGLGQREAVAHRLNDRRQVWAGVEQPELRFHREGMGAFLHDRGAFAVVLADDHQRAAGDAGGGEIGQRVGGDVDPHRALERHRPPDRVMDRRGQHRGGGGFVGVGLEPHPQFAPAGPAHRPARPSGD